jgi:hypothetical protein
VIAVYFLPCCALCTGAAFLHAGPVVSRLDWALCSRCTGIYRASEVAHGMLCWVAIGSGDIASFIDAMPERDCDVLLSAMRQWALRSLGGSQPMGQA